MSIVVGRPEYGGAFAAGDAALPFVLPGERIELAGAGALPIVLEASPARRAPGCVHFGTCGGCHYQHADEATQLHWKREILASLFEQAGLGDLPPIALEAVEAWHYRNRIRLRVEPGPGGLQVGYSRRGGNQFLPIVMCPIAAPLLWRAAEALQRLANEDAVVERWLGQASAVELFATASEGRLQMQLLLRQGDLLRESAGGGNGFEAFCLRVQHQVAELAGAGASLDPELNRRARRNLKPLAWGAAGLEYEAAGRPYWVSRGAFFQVNRFLAGRLVELIAQIAQNAADRLRGQQAWDLYAGVGLFSRVLAERFERVLAVEGGEPAASDLAIAGRRFGFEAHRAPALDFLRERQHQRERPGLVVLDPPRAGLGVEGAGLLASLRPHDIAYVSCDPVTLARDLAVLTGSGYRIAGLTLVDLFPQTFHVETVVHLTLAPVPAL